LLADALKLISAVPERTEISPETLDYLSRSGVPQEIIHDLRDCAFSDWVSIGPLDLVPLNELEKQTEGVRECIDHGWLVLAGCRNFDPIAVELTTRRMAFVSHDLLWDNHERFTECIHLAPYNYDDFWKAAAIDPGFPRDFYAAQERWPTLTKPVG
jgi:hypothetical protein